MKNEKELTLEELKAQYKALGEQIEKKAKAEEEEQKAKLKAEKAARKEELELAMKTYHTLLNAYIKDYGSYSATRSYTANKDEIPNLWRMFF